MWRAWVLGLMVFEVAAGQPPEVLWTTQLTGLFSTARDVIETSDHAFILIGYQGILEFGQYTHARLTKVSSTGELVWDRMVNGYPPTVVHAGVSMDEGEFVYTGYVAPNSPPWDKIFLRHVDAGGNLIWERFYDSQAYDRATCLVQCMDRGFAIGGNFNGAGMCLVRTNELGDSLWLRQYAAGGSATCTAITECADGGLMLAGWIAPTNPFYVWLIRTNPIGDTLWTRTLNFTGFDLPEAVRNTADGGFIMAGRTWPNSGILCKLDSSGVEQWHTVTPNGWLTDVHVLRDGYLLSGTDSCLAEGALERRDFYAMKTDGQGSILWRTSIGGVGEEFCWSAAITQDSGYVLAGYTRSSELPGENGFWAVRLGPDPIPTPPDSFCLELPEHRDTTDSRRGLFDWQDTDDPNPNDSVSYCLVFSGDSLFGIVQQRCDLRADSATVVWLGADSVWWRVEAHDLYGYMRLSCEQRRVYFPSLGQFHIVEPQDFMRRVQRFRWQRIPETTRSDSIRYTVRVASDSLFAQLLAERTTYDSVTTISFSAQPPAVTWTRVVAEDRFGNLLSAALDVGLAVGNVGQYLPTTTSLHPAYPNPFNPTTDIRFELARAGHARLSVFDLMGREVAVLVDEMLSAGSYARTFDGSAFASGVYLYRLESGDFSETKKMVLLR